jgi:hypothetical protein
MEVVLSLRTQLTQGTTGFNQRGAKLLGEFAKRRAIADGASPGHAIEIIGRDQFSVHREGDRRRQVKLSDLLIDITGDELDGRLHFRHHPLGFLDAFQAALAEPFLLGNGANLLDVSLNIRGDQLAVTAYPALQINKVVVVANAPDTRLDLLALLKVKWLHYTGHFGERVMHATGSDIE